MAHDSYTHPIDHRCTVIIPGTAHGFHGLSEQAITCVDPNNPGIPLIPALIEIDPESQDVRVDFFVAETGMIRIVNPAAEESF